MMICLKLTSEGAAAMNNAVRRELALAVRRPATLENALYVARLEDVLTALQLAIEAAR